LELGPLPHPFPQHALFLQRPYKWVRDVFEIVIVIEVCLVLQLTRLIAVGVNQTPNFAMNTTDIDPNAPATEKRWTLKLLPTCSCHVLKKFVILTLSPTLSLAVGGGAKWI
jgi:hypothetical protein